MLLVFSDLYVFLYDRANHLYNRVSALYAISNTLDNPFHPFFIDRIHLRSESVTYKNKKMKKTLKKTIKYGLIFLHPWVRVAIS